MPSNPKAANLSDNGEAKVPRRGRTLVLCFDGTSEYYSQWNSNIVHIFSLLRKDDPSQQLVYYQPGIGTYLVDVPVVGPVAQWIVKTLDRGLAFSLGGHVMSGYRFLMDNWLEGDRICLFGFSRGAYTARALAGMLFQIGLLPKGMEEEVPFAYAIYRKQQASAQYKRDFARTVNIEFIGVFDTVSAVGALIPRTLPFSSDNHITRTFRHALSLDEHRAAFQPQPWERTIDPPSTSGGRDEESGGKAEPMPQLGQKHVGIIRTGFSMLGKGLKKIICLGRSSQYDPTDYPSPQPGPSTDVKEVWFAGCHTDIGGGSDLGGIDYSLAHISLRWMLKEILIAPDGAGILWNESDPRFAALGIVLNPSATPSIATNGQGSRPSSGPTHSDYSAIAPLLRATPGSYEPDDAPSPHLPVDVRREDMLSPIHDALKEDPGWWIVEFLPFILASQKADDVWKNHIRVNLFRGRTIEPPPSPETSPNSRDSDDPDHRGANITTAPALFHVSVRERIEATAADLSAAAKIRADEDYALQHNGKKRGWQLFGSTKTGKYTPRAHLEGGGKPVFVR
ncbi:hypothetical protein DL93DRAFT_654962 [Clavulina sp. PMI_390]|nr:hypothetical protein DL93DRAFT_654962 [Clavulina sp. PMI_390]